MDKRPIGVFDSGIGGLTVLEELAKNLKNEDFIYVGDQGHCPYGVKENSEIEKCVLNVSNYLLNNDVKAIVIACNTASFFIESVRKITNIPVISVIDPTALYACKTTKNNKIAVLGTNATIKNGAYKKIIEEMNMDCFGIKASEFVDFAESHDLSNLESFYQDGLNLVKEKLEYIKSLGCDTIIHGCTHFSLLEPFMKKYYSECNYIACGTPTTMELKEILEKTDSLNTPHDRYIKIYTTGDKEKAIMNMKWFSEPHDEIEKIDID